MAQRCQCTHYRFGHDKCAGRCDDCGCTGYKPACDMCDGSGRILVAPAADTVDWAAAQPMACIRCAHGT